MQYERPLQTVFMTVCCLAPHGASGLKSENRAKQLKETQSCSARSKWIEIFLYPPSRSKNSSCSARSKWIEINSAKSRRRTVGSCSARSKWIEILVFNWMISTRYRLAPHGASGLKSILCSNIFAPISSCSARSKWIEISGVARATQRRESLAPHGASGLKFR